MHIGSKDNASKSPTKGHMANWVLAAEKATKPSFYHLGVSKRSEVIYKMACLTIFQHVRNIQYQMENIPILGLKLTARCTYINLGLKLHGPINMLKINSISNITHRNIPNTKI